MKQHTPFAIFDMDGTLVDSTDYWNQLSHEFLHSKGIFQIPEDLLTRIKHLTVAESVDVFIDQLGLAGNSAVLSREMNDMMARHYERDVPAKDGAADYLQALQRQGVTMCVASATAPDLIDLCLDRLGLRQYFAFILSCEEVGAGKSQPDVYLTAARRLGAAPEEITVYEDAVHALFTAKSAGFRGIAIYDEQSPEDWKNMQDLADGWITDWKEAAK